ncbi:hypothetical protein CICLE_v10031484mg [Citrus x clementina]|uniref:Uncharacterized protein n=1 Tax=Citrus clementina TaxID=85681 RepID=V4TDN3_CITCL|nr:hypothetical protein CICLE_v10031484mg [Citrus x clementina]
MNIISSRCVKIREVTRVTPFFDSTASTNDNPLPSTALALTYFDTKWFKFPPVQRLFFYRNQTSDTDSIRFNSEILPQLKHSLSLALLHYLPLAGHIMWPELEPKPAVYYFPDQKCDGVSFVVAESSDADFDRVSGDGIREAAEYHPLVPQFSITEDKAEVIAIQITLFPNQGFSIGVSAHHAVLDGKSTTLFIKSWAYLCKQLKLQQQQQQQEQTYLPPELTPCFDRTVVKDPDGIDLIYLKHWMSGSSSNRRSLNVMPVKPENYYSNLVRMTFELNREDINKLRDKVNEVLYSTQGGAQYLSSFVITCAHVFVWLVKARDVEANTTVRFVITTDSKASGFMQENGFAFVAHKLSDLIKGIKRGAVLGSEDEFLNGMAKMREAQQLKISVAGSNRFDVYGSDFGWGRPEKVEVVSIDTTGAISLAETRDGCGGFEIGVVLEKQQMEVFASLFVDALKDL